MARNPFRTFQLRGTTTVVRVSALVLLLAGIGAGLFPILSHNGIDSLAVKNSPAEQEVSTDDVSDERSSAQLREDRLREEQAVNVPTEEEVSQARTDAQAMADGVSEELSRRVTDAEKKREERIERAKPTPTPTPKPGPTVPIPADCSGYSGNRAVGCALLSWAGFGLDQMDCLDKLWTKESGWRVEAYNSSGAQGIPQAKPGNKMAAYGDDWETNPEVQIKWGLQYIKGKYGTPCGGWEYFQNNGWY